MVLGVPCERIIHPSKGRGPQAENTVTPNPCFFLSPHPSSPQLVQSLVHYLLLICPPGSNDNLFIFETESLYVFFAVPELTM